MKPGKLIAQARLDSPLGLLTAAATEHGLAGLWFDGQAHHPGPLPAPVDAANPHLAQARAELRCYFAGAGRGPLRVALDPQGTEFQRRVWRALRTIAPGHATTYAALAAAIGAPTAARAVGAAVGRNPIAILVPCHRVVGSDGNLTGYGGGLWRKRRLLEIERRT